ncbi:RsmB/NOP family class I SAM-dependent RNA methyltransferase [Yoonia sp. F2084L]|uniref:RsmB/NOP family class I SAM-dependent RNA methyltransferase n=1 Tax=Yoonia sp. F2084L TaxID=2926419 RepID=UPI001FF5B9AE|nr:RsmB/NOP family class I SAM-dependent RNA methyltransferase [Yoonia sp. F2084L]MCK0094662.1 RsmB/NOP family class I SAM-dependent RNA methyltransferase [Yoonia sp. F2084L]
MTPGARVAAAIAVLDQINAGTPAEQALTAWARGSRYAGSKDRAAVRDHVFDVLRAKRSLGDGAGRNLMQRLAVRDSLDVAALFSGEGHAPAALTAAEQTALETPLQLWNAARCDVPEWLWPAWQNSLGDQAMPAALAQQERADVFLRVNTRRGSPAKAAQALAADGVTVIDHESVPGCLRVLANPRRVKTTAAYLDGLIELQDASSQWAVQETPVLDGARVLDFCAGGGGKALAFADRYDADVSAHDIAPQRMRDLPGRAARAGVDIAIVHTDDLPSQDKWDVVFCDAPCSGSGTWRRTPDAKWRLTPDRLSGLMQTQRDVLENASGLVAPGGVLVYATCSVLADENADTVAAFCNVHPRWQVTQQNQRLPDGDGDGFFHCVLMHQ